MHCLWKIRTRNNSGSESSPDRIDRMVLASLIVFLVFLGVVGGVYANATLFAATASTPKAPDFFIATDPLSQTVAERSQGTYMIGLSSQNGFSGSVNVTASLSPAAPSATITILPDSISLLTGSGNVSMTITISDTVAIGTYLLNITAASRALSHSMMASLIVTSPKDFELTSSTSSETISAGSSSNTTITVTSLNGYAGNVTLAAYVSQGHDNGPKPTLNIDTMTLTPGESQTTVLSLSTSNGNKAQSYTVTVLAISGSVSHSVTISVTGLAKISPPRLLATQSYTVSP